MNIPKSKIAILTTVANFELYNKTSLFFPKGIKQYVIDGTNHMYGRDSIVYMISKFKNLGVEWLIMADEDVIFSQPNQIFSIIEKMNRDDFTVSGVRDGGVVKHRNHNPHLINTFFSILNIKNILQIWDKKEMLKNQYIIPNEFTDNLDYLSYAYDESSLFELYYCFYLWLRRHDKKFLFLDAKMEADGIANTVYFNNVPILCHTWYARNYSKDHENTKRIDGYIPKTRPEISMNNNPIIFKDKFYILKVLYPLFKDKIIKTKNVLLTKFR